MEIWFFRESPKPCRRRRSAAPRSLWSRQKAVFEPVCGLRPAEGPRRPPMAPQIAHKHHREHGKLALGLWGSCYQYMRSTECPLGIRVSERRPLGSGRSRTPAFAAALAARDQQCRRHRPTRVPRPAAPRLRPQPARPARAARYQRPAARLRRRKAAAGSGRQPTAAGAAHPTCWCRPTAGKSCSARVALAETAAALALPTPQWLRS